LLSGKNKTGDKSTVKVAKNVNKGILAYIKRMSGTAQIHKTRKLDGQVRATAEELGQLAD